MRAKKLYRKSEKGDFHQNVEIQEYNPETSKLSSLFVLIFYLYEIIFHGVENA